jgi:hypothetical protein
MPSGSSAPNGVIDTPRSGNSPFRRYPKVEVGAWNGWTSTLASSDLHPNRHQWPMRQPCSSHRAQVGHPQLSASIKSSCHRDLFPQLLPPYCPVLY